MTASMPPARHLVFALPGSLHTLTGGTVYDRRIAEGLRALGWTVDLRLLDASFPFPSPAALAQAQAAFEALPDGSLALVDGLAFGALPALAQKHAQRLRWVALVHHPLALETGLAPQQRQALFDSEREALSAARGVIVTSPATALALGEYGVGPGRVQVVEPGTDPAPSPTAEVRGAAGDGPITLLCVATLTPRKGHLLLLQALAGLQDRPWELHCIGSTTRDAATTAQLREFIDTHGWQQRVHLHGECEGAALQTWYARADAFVLPSFHEGYGMALAEALAHGLPVVSTTAGAIPATVPAGAGVLVPPGDAPALRAALARLLDEPAWRAQLAAGARSVAAKLPTWPQAAAKFAAALDAIAPPEAAR